MRLLGKTTVLDIHIEKAHRHPQAFLLALEFNAGLIEEQPWSFMLMEDGR